MSLRIVHNKNESSNKINPFQKMDNCKRMISDLYEDLLEISDQIENHLNSEELPKSKTILKYSK